MCVLHLLQNGFAWADRGNRPGTGLSHLALLHASTQISYEMLLRDARVLKDLPIQVRCC